MDAYRINIKLYFESNEIDQEKLIPIFHRYIQQKTIDELLIDVADYKHVPDGPGVMLIAHDANYSIDSSDGELGLLYAHKRPSEGSFETRVRRALRQTLVIAAALEKETGLGVKVKTHQLAIRLNDRLLAPNTDATQAVVEPVLRSLFAELYEGQDVSFERETAPRQAFGLRLETRAKLGIEALLERLEAPSLIAKAS